MEFVMNNLLFRDLSPLALTIITIGALLLNAACGGKEDTKTHAAALPPATVVVADVAQKTVPIYNEFVGQTKPSETVELRARVEGVLEHIYFTEGAPVRKGELLMP